MKELWKISVGTSLEAEEALLELLRNLFGREPSSYTDQESGRITASLFLPARSGWRPETRAALRAGLAHIRASGLKLGPARVSVTKVRHENWAESWKKHFRPIEIGPRLLIKPTWSRRRSRSGQVTVLLDPGLSFGTGQHPTTHFCLRQLAQRRRDDEAQSFLDLGTGSGILAIAAAKLGYAPVEAVDSDPASIRTARANARLNHALSRIGFRRQDLAEMPLRSSNQYSVVCANLMATLLLEQRDRIIARVAEGGLLVLAGILRTEFGQVQRGYTGTGLRLVARSAEGEWCSGGFSRPPRCHSSLISS